MVETEASIEELKMEARLTAPKGWFAELQGEIDDENYFDTMNEEGFEPEEGEPILGEGPSLPPLPASLPIAYVAHLFSGRRCADDFEDYITRPGRDAGVMAIVISIDMIISANYDFLDTGKCAKPRAAAASVFCIIIIIIIIAIIIM